MIKDIFDTYRDAFRQWMRTKTRPKSVYEAEEKRLFWSKCYLFSAVCVVGIYLYQLSLDKANSRTGANSIAFRLAKDMNENEPLKVIKYSGFKQISSKTFGPRELEKENDLNKKPSTPEVT